MSRGYVRLKRSTEGKKEGGGAGGGGNVERKGDAHGGAPPDCRAYGYKRRQESERRRVINLAVFHVSRRGRALLMETSFETSIFAVPLREARFPPSSSPVACAVDSVAAATGLPLVPPFRSVPSRGVRATSARRDARSIAFR